VRAVLLAAAFLLATAPQGLAADFELREHIDGSRALRLPSQMPVARSEPHTYLLPTPAPATSPSEQDRTAGLPVYSGEFRPAPRSYQPANLLHIGPVQTEIVNGHTRYRIEGVSVMGGSISGSVSGRGAKIFLRWRNN